VDTPLIWRALWFLIRYKSEMERDTEVNIFKNMYGTYVTVGSAYPSLSVTKKVNGAICFPIWCSVARKPELVCCFH